MRQKDAWKHFEGNALKELTEQAIAQIQEELDSNHDEIWNGFWECLKTLYQENENREVSSVEVSMLMTSLLAEKEPLFLIQAKHRGNCIAERDYHPIWLFAHWYKLKDALYLEAKRYVGSLCMAKLDRRLLQEAQNYMRILSEWCKEELGRAAMEDQELLWFFVDGFKLSMGGYGENHMLLFYNGR